MRHEVASPSHDTTRDQARELHPFRVRAAVLCGGYSIQNTTTPGPPASPQAVRNSWYQWYFNTETGREGLTKNRKALCRYMWQEWSPTWRFTDAMYEQTAASFENPDFVDCVLHSYRHRNFNAPSEPRFVDVEKRLATRPKVEVPTIVLHGGDDGFGAGGERLAMDLSALPGAAIALGQEAEQAGRAFELAAAPLKPLRPDELVEEEQPARHERALDREKELLEALDMMH